MAADLGIISPRRAIVLDKETSRADFMHFVVELLPQTPPTNIVTLIKTNDLLTAGDMAHTPSGRGVMGVWAVYADGAESKVAIYSYDLRRGTPATPSARPIHILTTNEPVRSLTNELRKIRETPVSPPPLPAAQTRIQLQLPSRPLPNATNRAYSDHLDWLADRAARGLRRGE